MEIEERNAGDVTILDLKGKMTLGEGDEALRDKANSLVLRGRNKILLNMAKVSRIDSAGLARIDRTYTIVRRQGGNLKLLNLPKRVTDFVVTTSLVVFEVYDNEADAISSFTSRPAGARADDP